MTNFNHLIILDESGSMSCIRQSALSGCNETIQNIRLLQQKATDAEPQQHYLTLVVFNSDHSCHYLYDHLPISECEELKPDAYSPDACTPLYDAIGLSVCHLRDQVGGAKNPQDTEEALVSIITDGYENSSTIFDGKKVKSLISELKQQGWTFAFIGTNIDVEAEADRIGIHNTMNFEQTDHGTHLFFANLFSNVADYCQAAPEERKRRRESDFFRDDR